MMKGDHVTYARSIASIAAHALQKVANTSLLNINNCDKTRQNDETSLNQHPLFELKNNRCFHSFGEIRYSLGNVNYQLSLFRIPKSADQ